MVRLVKSSNDNYTNVSNEVVRDKRLTWKARGIFTYLWSQADNWQFYTAEIEKHAPEGRQALQNGLKELEKYGYLKRSNAHNQLGKFDGKTWVLNDSPSNGKPVAKPEKAADKPSNGKPVGRENRRTDNLQLRNNNSKNYQHKELTKTREEVPAPPVPSLSDEFEQLWKDYPNKSGKQDAFRHYKAWRKAGTAKEPHEPAYLAKRLALYKELLELMPDRPVLNGSTWFNGRFEDDYLDLIRAAKKRANGRYGKPRRVEKPPKWQKDEQAGKAVKKTTAKQEQEVKAMLASLKLDDDSQEEG